MYYDTNLSLKCNNMLTHSTQGLSMIQGQGQTTPHNTPASEEGDNITRLGLLNQLVSQHPKVSPVWPQRHRELTTHLSPAHNVTTSSHFHLEMGSDSAPGGLQLECKSDFSDWGEAGQVDGEGAVVLLRKLLPAYLLLAGSKV